MIKNDLKHAPGKHLILDLFEIRELNKLDNPVLIEELLRKAAKICNAKILNLNLHHFGGSGGVTGVALLAESHISIHTWPELSYIAIDIFLCGDCAFDGVIKYFEESFQTTNSKITILDRG